MFLEFLDPLSSQSIGLTGMNDASHRIHRLRIDEQLEFNDVALTPCRFLVIETGIALRNAFELAKEIVDQMSKWKIVSQDDLRCCKEGKLLLLTPVAFTKLDDFAQIFFGEGHSD